MKVSAKQINLLLLLSIAIAVLLRIIYLDSREFWYDEVLSLLLSTGKKGNYNNPQDTPILLANYTSLLQITLENSFSAFLITTEKFLKGLMGEPHPFLFFLQQYIWLRFWGNSEAAMRSIIVLFSLGSIACAYGLGRRLLGNQGGLLFAALLGLNPYYLFHSLNVRMYCPLVFWVLLSSWSLLELVTLKGSSFKNKNDKLYQVFWIVLLIFSLASGLMTFYYFAVFMLALSVLVLWLDRRRWWQYAVYFIASVLITIPWVLWGTRQQLRNADLGRFSSKGNLFINLFKHFQQFLDVLGIHLLIGDWSSILSPFIITLAGFFVVIILSFCSFYLWKNQQHKLLTIGLIIGVLPLVLMLIIDIVTGKFTLAFGWGRSVIFVLPGCLLLLVIYLEKANIKFKSLAIIGILLLYLTINITDFSLRSRRMFHTVADIINQQPNSPTLIIMDSQAWGHVLRLAYYLPVTSPISLLSQKSNKFVSIVEKNLNQNTQNYNRILWLQSHRPVWGKPSTEEQKQQVKNILNQSYNLQQSQALLGTWELDNFTLNVYQKNR
ncbi:MAG: glycosyltransferase family 39 protein [Crocosphaera sp.]|nr:glycosyltransferase family 39 protein [Crocosphaera sp.]